MQEKTYPYTFNNFDETKNRVLITPHGPDPVFYGIRGENTKSLLQASKLLKVYGYVFSCICFTLFFEMIRFLPKSLQ